MRKIVLTVASLVFAGWFVPSTAGAAPLALDSEVDKGSYLMGYSSGMQILQRLGPVIDKDALQAGFAEAVVSLYSGAGKHQCASAAAVPTVTVPWTGRQNGSC